MATLEWRCADNVPGRFYVDETCLDCDVCRTVAPTIFSRNDTEFRSFVIKQPETPEELALCKEARDACPCESIGDDGDSVAWIANSPPSGGPSIESDERRRRIEQKTCGHCSPKPAEGDSN